MILPHTIATKKRLVFLSLTLPLLLPALLSAETVDTKEWQISADKITRYEDPQSIVAEGNIVLTKIEKLPPKPIKKESMETDWSLLLEEKVDEPVVTPEELPEEGEARYETKVVIKADWIAYDVALENIKARGNVSIKTGGDQLFAEKGTVNLKQMTGTFENATILRQEKDLHLEGSVIEKTGLKTYRIQDGWVITCKIDKNKTPPWRFAAADTEVTKGGYAYLKHAKFYVKDLPIFYTPYMVLPAKETRQTGLLFPEMSYSKNSGFGLNIPFFLNISSSADMTFYPEIFSNRGVMPGIEFRYINSTANKGMFMGSYLYDNLSDPSETDYYEDTEYTHTNKDRYWLRGKIDHTFEDDWITRLDVDIVSDQDYLEEFNSGLTGRKETNSRYVNMFGRGFENVTDSKRKNSLKVLKNWGGISIEAKFLAVNDASDTPKTSTITNEDGTTTTVTNTTPIWQLPSIETSGIHSIGDSTVSLAWDADYVNFWREEGVGGHRLDIYPRLSMPIPLGPYFESRAQAGIRETLYMVESYGDSEWEGSDTPSRFLYDFNAEVGTTLLRDYAMDNSSTYDGWTHEVRPFVQYEYIADEDQDDLPQFNSVDIISDRNSITYGVTNFISLFGSKEIHKQTVDKKRPAEETFQEFSDQIAKITVQQTYDLRSDITDELGPIELEVYLTPWKDFNFEYKTHFDADENDFIYHRVSSDFSNSRGDYFELDYKYDDGGDTEQLNAGFSLKLLASLTGEYEIKYSLSEDEVNEQIAALKYQAACWSVTFKSSYTPEDTSFMLMFELLNIGTPFRMSM